MQAEEELAIYYNNAIKQTNVNTEHLFDDVSKDFISCVEELSANKCKVGMDIGYGYGNYTLCMLDHDFYVDAIDLIETDMIFHRIPQLKVEERFNAFKCNIMNFQFKRKYDLVVAKDVLHFLSENDMRRILNCIKKWSKKNAINYFVVFTNITRKDKRGKIKYINGEARLSQNELIEIINSIYTDWMIEIKSENYIEYDKYNEGYYFKAIKNTIIVKNRKGEIKNGTGE